MRSGVGGSRLLFRTVASGGIWRRREEVRQHPGTGPCGSKKIKYLVSKDEVQDWLEDDSAGLRGSWGKRKSEIGRVNMTLLARSSSHAKKRKSITKMLLSRVIHVGNAAQTPIILQSG